jgi:hypothetical protein
MSCRAGIPLLYRDPAIRENLEFNISETLREPKFILNLWQRSLSEMLT